MNEQIKQEAQSLGIPYEKKGRTLVWHDEFQAAQLDRTKWGFARTMGASDREFDNSEFCCRKEGDKLLMQVHKSEKEGADYRLPEGLCTRETMVYRYGYVEMRANLPYRHGAWPSFWLQSATPFSKATYMSEIDVLEVFSSENRLYSNIHKWGGGQHCAIQGDENKINVIYTFEKYADLNNEYHVYGFEWDETYMHFYVDDQRYCTFLITEEGDKCFPQGIHPGMAGFHDFHYLIMNNEIFSAGGSWHPEGWILTEQDPLPIEYRIDWVRLYQDPSKGEEIKLGDEIAAAKR